jgi:uncharacterized protein YbjT (DUF2867 family)
MARASSRRRIAVAGSTGLIGSQVVQHAAQLGRENLIWAAG